MQSATLEGNILKYSLLKIFTKRVFLPLIAIHLTLVGNVTLAELGIIASVSAITQLILEVPLGYIADRWGHKRALVFGALLTTISVLPYIFIPGFYGGLLASVLFCAGWAFSSGTTQAFMHETLMSLGREDEYVKIMGKAQSYGLLGNVALVSLVPLTYSIHHSIPFILGFLCLFISLLFVLSLKEPPVRLSVEKEKIGIIAELKEGLSRRQLLQFLLVFLIFGIVAATFSQTSNYRELIFRDLGVPVQYFGFILGFGSLLAAFVGKHIHRLKHFKPEQFYLFDILYVSTLFVLVGVLRNPILSILAFSLAPAYDRTRNIIFESRLFEEFPRIRHKSTLVSVMNFFEFGNAAWTPLLLALFVHQTGLISGHLYFGLTIFIILVPILLLHNYNSRKNNAIMKK